MECGLPGSSVHGNSQARVPEWIAMPSSRGSSSPRDQIWVSCIAGRVSIAEPPGKPPGMDGTLQKSLIYSSLKSQKTRKNAVQKSQETWVRSLDEEDPLEEGMATHYSILA